MTTGNVSAAGANAGAGGAAGGASGASGVTGAKGDAARGTPTGPGAGGKWRSFGEVLGGHGTTASHGAAVHVCVLEALACSASKAKGAQLGMRPNGAGQTAQHGAGAHARADARDEKDREKQGDRFDALDPSERHAAQLAPPLSFGAFGASSAPSGSPVPSEIGARASMETLVPALVKKIAWSGDAKRGTVRIELGAGPLEGGTLLVHADDGRVRVHLSAPAGADGAAWKERIEKRLAARGLDVEDVVVD